MILRVAQLGSPCKRSLMTMKPKQPKKERLDEVQAAHRMVRAFTEKHEGPSREPSKEAAPRQPATEPPPSHDRETCPCMICTVLRQDDQGGHPTGSRARPVR